MIKKYIVVGNIPTTCGKYDTESKPFQEWMFHVILPRYFKFSKISDYSSRR